MTVYQNLYGHVTPVDSQGEHFPVGSAVTFSIHGQEETGTISKQLAHSAVIKITLSSTNQEMMVQTNGRTVVNYHQLNLIRKD